MGGNFLNQYKALVVKNVIVRRRNWSAYIWGMLAPILCLFLLWYITSYLETTVVPAQTPTNEDFSLANLDLKEMANFPEKYCAGPGLLWHCDEADYTGGVNLTLAVALMRLQMEHLPS